MRQCQLLGWHFRTEANAPGVNGARPALPRRVGHRGHASRASGPLGLVFPRSLQRASILWPRTSRREAAGVNASRRFWKPCRRWVGRGRHVRGNGSSRGSTEPSRTSQEDDPHNGPVVVSKVSPSMPLTQFMGFFTQAHAWPWRSHGDGRSGKLPSGAIWVTAIGSTATYSRRNSVTESR